MPTTIMTTSSRRNPPNHDQASASPSSSRSHRSSLTPSSSNPSNSTNSSSPSRFSTYTPTTISNYQRRMNIKAGIEGLPGPAYFSSGQSKVDRRREYIQPPATQPSVVGSRRSGSVAGKEMVRYRSSDQEMMDSGDEDDDHRTLMPEDSISQVSYPSSSTSSKRRDSGVNSSRSGRGGSTFSSLSTFQSERVFDGTRKCYLVERRPRVSAGSW